jgi:hypothetical protein
MNSRTGLMDLGQRWIPPAGLERSRPRRVKLTGAGRALLILAVALGLGAAAAGAGLGILARSQAAELRQLEREGMVTEGRITRLWRSSGKDRQPWLAYSFTLDGQTHEQKAKVPLLAWKSYKVGSALAVRYIPSRPGINHPLGHALEPIPPWVPAFVALALASGGLLATLPIRRQRRLLADGRPSPGLVAKHGKRVRTSHGSDLGVRYEYEFLLLSGAIAKGQAGPTKSPPAIGSTIAVLYDPDNPRENAPFPFSLAKLESN